MKVNKPYRLSQSFVNGITEVGRYGDGRGSKGLSLLVKVTKSGDVSKSYTQRIRQTNGKWTSKGLGAHPYVSLKDARDMAYENVRQASGVMTPTMITQFAPVSETTLAPTLREIKDDYIDANVGGWAASTHKTYQSVIRNLNGYQQLADIPINMITSKDVIDALRPEWRSKHSSAEMAYKKIVEVFEHAKSYDYIDRNVARDARRGFGKVNKQVKSAQYLPYSEMPEALFRAAKEGNARSQITKKALLFMLLTSTRVSTAMSFEWTDIKQGDDGAFLEIPDDRDGVKGAQGFRIPLSRQAYQLAMSVQPEAGFDDDDMRIFPRLPSAVADFLKRHDLDFTPHGIRTTFTTWAQEQTIYDVDLIDECLAHVNLNKVQKSYFRSDKLERRRAVMQEYADYMMTDIDAWLESVEA